jgi:hypothetical protein
MMVLRGRPVVALVLSATGFVAFLRLAGTLKAAIPSTGSKVQARVAPLSALVRPAGYRGIHRLRDGERLDRSAGQSGLGLATGWDAFRRNVWRGTTSQDQAPAPTMKTHLHGRRRHPPCRQSR